jgi:hypothetical protein
LIQAQRCQDAEARLVSAMIMNTTLRGIALGPDYNRSTTSETVLDQEVRLRILIAQEVLKPAPIAMSCHQIIMVGTLRRSQFGRFTNSNEPREDAGGTSAVRASAAEIIGATALRDLAVGRQNDARMVWP